MYHLQEIQTRTPQLIQQLTAIWEKSVQATHTFLSDAEIRQIKTYVPKALAHVAHLILTVDASNTPVGFMGIQDQTLEMLFLAPEVTGTGLGKKLLLYGIQNYGVKKLTVNEQNPNAIGFYEHMGFQTYQRTEQDEQGNPYPLLYMQLQQN
jgi:putative acetyltransferase